MKIIVLTLALVLGSVAQAAPFGLGGKGCRAVFDTVKDVGFSASKSTQLKLSLLNRMQHKALGVAMIDNMQTHFGYNLYFRNGGPGTREAQIGKTGTVIVYELYETQSLYIGEPQTFKSYYKRSYAGKLISFSTYDRRVTIENSQGRRVTLTLPEPRRTTDSVSSQLHREAQNNVGWDGDLVRLRQKIGYLLTFVPNKD